VIEEDEEDLLLEEDEILLFQPVGSEVYKVLSEFQGRKLSLSQSRVVAARMVYGIMTSDINSQEYIDSIFDHAKSEESGSRVMARVRVIKQENLH
jgi:hypothetical protein